MLLTRRRLLQVAGAVVPTMAWAHTLGPVKPPEALPAIKVTTVEGKVVELGSLLRERVTGVQLMFTRCTAMCPIQGAIYGEAQKKLERESPQLQLWSISIDAKGDSPKSMAVWLTKMGAVQGRWSGAVVAAGDLDALFDAVRGRAEGADSHTAQVYVFNRKAELTFRTAEMPTASEVVSTMQRVAEMK